MNDIEYMKIALKLAKKGVGRVNPNPLVGAVVVKAGRVIGEGYHKHFGQPHAEVNAFKGCRKAAVGATLYVTLEPCSHFGKTPPCADLVVESGVAKVVIGSRDPNPLVAGRGIKRLQDAGIDVVEGVLASECEALNEVFFHYVTKQTPYVVMKYAMTMDGKIATRTGQSRWITGEAARTRVHEDRNRYSAIMVGVGTVLADDPMLDCRLDGGRSPVRIICDTNLRTPLDAKVVTTAKEIRTLIATASEDYNRWNEYLAKGCEMVSVGKYGEYLDLQSLMYPLGKYGIDSILLEGGATLNWSALEAKIVNKVQTYIAPKIFGGLDVKTPVAGLGVDTPSHSYVLEQVSIEILGDDILIESNVGL